MKQRNRAARGIVAAVAALALTFSMAPTVGAVAAPGDAVRIFDDEALGAPASCSVVGDVTVAEAAFGGAAAANRALRIDDQSNGVHTRAQCTDALSAEKSVSFRFAPSELETGVIVALLGGPGSSGNGVWRFSFVVTGDDIHVQAYSGTAWKTVALISGGAALDEWTDLTINATLERAEFIVGDARYATQVRVAPATTLGDVLFASSGTAPTGVEFFIDDLAMSDTLPATAFVGAELETVFDEALAVSGEEVAGAPVVRFLLPEGANPDDYSAEVSWQGSAVPAEVSGPDAEGRATVKFTHTFPESGAGLLRTLVTDGAGAVSAAIQPITVDAFANVTVATAPQGVQIRFPDVIELHDGRLFVVYHEASGHTQANGIIRATTSSDDGVTWTEPVTVVDIPHDARDPKVAQLSDGTIVVTYFEYKWSQPRAVQPFITRSTDDGATWSEPALVSNPMSCACGMASGWAATHGPVVELENGDLLMPLYGTMADDSRERATIVRSTDGGATWDADSMVTLAVGSIRFQEPNLTVLPSGEIIALIRTTSSPVRAYISRSFDNGLTWTEAIPTDIPAESHHQLLTSDGRLLLTYGNPELPGRPTQGILIEDPSADWDGYADDAVLVYDSGNGDQGNPSSVEIGPGEYLTLGYDVRTRTLTAVFTEAADYRPADDAMAAPAKGELSSDEGWDTGLSDGDFTVSMDLWWGANATIFRLYRDGELIADESLDPASPDAQHAEVPVSGLPNGEYTFTGELINSEGSSRFRPLTVEVNDANPSKPVLSHDNHDRDGDYTLTANLWWGTNATSYTFFENGEQVATGELEDASPAAQVATLEVVGKAPGTYTYTVEFINAAGTTESKEVTVTVEA